MKAKVSILIYGIVILQSCFKEDDYDKVAADQLIKYLSNTSQQIADGKLSAEIKVKISEDAANNMRKVVFKTNLGFFENGMGDSVVIDAGNEFIATARLLSVNEGDAIISATIQGFKAQNPPVIKFLKAFPESISVSVDSFVIYNNFSSETIVTTTLRRLNGGWPSTGHRVDFRVTDLFDNPIGSFLNGQSFARTNSDGKAVIRYSAGPSTYQGQLKITATTIKEDNSSIQSTTQIYLSQ